MCISCITRTVCERDEWQGWEGFVNDTTDVSSPYEQEQEKLTLGPPVLRS